MWLCTDLGFFSVVRKGANQYHIRARVRRDLENLKTALAVDLSAHLPDIQRWPTADYRWRVVVTFESWAFIGNYLIRAISYDNFKSRISSLPDQRHKLRAYHELWHAGVDWQEAAPSADHIKGLVYTSVDDMRSSLPHHTDLSLLKDALSYCEGTKQKTKAALIRRRIKQLESEH